MSAKRDYYEVLGVPKSAASDELKKVLKTSHAIKINAGCLIEYNLNSMVNNITVTGPDYKTINNTQPFKKLFPLDSIVKPIRPELAGIKYYINAIKNIIFDNLYISTDDKNHSIIIQLLELYPSSQLINYDEITTIQFANTCKHIILSHGSFSAVIGYLSFFSN
jgi:hypothetical protein